jgi:hypothetical protein
LSQLDEDERLLAEGLLRGGSYIMVTPDRILWMRREGLVSLRFDQVHGMEEILEHTHRYRLQLRHEPIELPPERPPLPWDLPAHLRQAERRRREAVETDLPFSRRDTAAAIAIREQLLARFGDEALARPPTVLPHRREKTGGYLYRVRRPRAWWLGWRFGRGINGSFGAWRGRRFTGAKYVDRLRKGLGRRLRPPH